MKKKLGPGAKRFSISVIVTAVIASLIYWEQIAILYVLSTLALIALLVAVAASDLESVGQRLSNNIDEQGEGSADAK